MGDVVRVGTEGAGRITSIASDTSATFAATLPDDGAGTGLAAYVHENLSFKVGSETSRRINTINNAGTTMVMDGAAAGSAGGQAGTWGVETQQWLAARR